jgi:hypothetical protein
MGGDSERESEWRGKELYYEANISSRLIVTSMLTTISF